MEGFGMVQVLILATQIDWESKQHFALPNLGSKKIRLWVLIEIFGINVPKNLKQDLVLKFGMHMEELKAPWII